MSTNDLKGLRVLVVEDEAIIGLYVVELLRDAGCEVVGPIATLEAALELARQAPLDVAVLDVNLDGAEIFPVAAELRTRGIPFALATGYGEQVLPCEWRAVPCLHKPFDDDQLTELIGHLMRR